MNLKPQDLRLGIIIHDTVRNTNTTLQLKHFRELSISEEQFFNRYKPVSITEEMLLDFGFEKQTELLIHYRIDGFKICRWIDSLKVLRIDSLADLYFAHEIQSLYYILNGEELNISKFLLRN